MAIQTRGFGVDVMPSYTAVDPSLIAAAPGSIVNGASSALGVFDQLQKLKAYKAAQDEIEATRQARIAAENASKQRSLATDTAMTGIVGDQTAAARAAALAAAARDTSALRLNSQEEATRAAELAAKQKTIPAEAARIIAQSGFDVSRIGSTDPILSGAAANEAARAAIEKSKYEGALGKGMTTQVPARLQNMMTALNAENAKNTTALNLAALSEEADRQKLRQQTETSRFGAENAGLLSGLGIKARETAISKDEAYISHLLAQAEKDKALAAAGGPDRSISDIGTLSTAMGRLNAMPVPSADDPTITVPMSKYLAERGQKHGGLLGFFKRDPVLNPEGEANYEQLLRLNDLAASAAARASGKYGAPSGKGAPAKFDPSTLTGKWKEAYDWAVKNPDDPDAKNVLDTIAKKAINNK